MTSSVIYMALALLGLCMGSFTNAFTWRLREQERAAKIKSAKQRRDALKRLSIVNGRSMCTHCKHVLGAADLVPLFSWLWLRGKCRYCRHAIDDSPWIEFLLPIAFVLSYWLWPWQLAGMQWASFGLWLIALVIMAMLIVYDARWMLLPDRLVAALAAIAALRVVVVYTIERPGVFGFVTDVALSVAIASGLFYLLYQMSNGKWVGGGDVKLGVALAFLVVTPLNASLVLFAASILGTVYALPGMIGGRIGRMSRLPFGPFLMVGAFVVVLVGQRLVDWYLMALGLQ